MESDGRLNALCTCVRNHRVQLFMTPWTIVCQAPLSMEFSRQEYQSGLLFPPPGDLPDSGMEPKSLGSPALAGRFFPTEPPGKPLSALEFLHCEPTPLILISRHI